MGNIIMLIVLRIVIAMIAFLVSTYSYAGYFDFMKRGKYVFCCNPHEQICVLAKEKANCLVIKGYVVTNCDKCQLKHQANATPRTQSK